MVWNELCDDLNWHKLIHIGLLSSAVKLNHHIIAKPSLLKFKIYSSIYEAVLPFSRSAVGYCMFKKVKSHWQSVNLASIY